MIRASGTSPRMIGSASTPSMTGIARSSRTTSGRSARTTLDPGPPVAGLADDVHPAAGEHDGEELADVAGVVDDDGTHRPLAGDHDHAHLPLQRPGGLQR